MRNREASKAFLRLATPLETALVVVATLLLAFALRLYRLADSNIWWDEGCSVWLARQIFGASPSLQRLMSIFPFTIPRAI